MPKSPDPLAGSWRDFYSRPGADLAGSGLREAAAAATKNLHRFRHLDLAHARAKLAAIRAHDSAHGILLAPENGVLANLLETPLVPRHTARLRLQVTSAHEPAACEAAAGYVAAAITRAYKLCSGHVAAA